MGKHNALQRAARCPGRAIVTLIGPALLYGVLVGIAGWFAPSGKSRCRLARKLNCDAAMVPDALLRYAMVDALAGLISLLYLAGLIVAFAH